jgi:hypothetical protein
VLNLRPSLARRGIAIAGVLAIAVLGGGASIAAAGSGDPKADSAATEAAKADDVAAGEAKDGRIGEKPKGADTGVPAGLKVQTRQALDGLAAAGTINQAQADAIQSRVASGTVDEREVIASGVLNTTQMERVDDVLRAIKLSYTGP